MTEFWRPKGWKALDNSIEVGSNLDFPQLTKVSEKQMFGCVKSAMLYSAMRDDWIYATRDYGITQ